MDFQVGLAVPSEALLGARLVHHPRPCRERRRSRMVSGSRGAVPDATLFASICAETSLAFISSRSDREDHQQPRTSSLSHALSIMTSITPAQAG